MSYNKTGRISQASETSNGTQDDFNKLMHICNSYGLNEEETSQLISQFRRGSLLSLDQSMNESLNDSCCELTFSKPTDEEYSFQNHQLLSSCSKSKQVLHPQSSQQLQVHPPETHTKKSQPKNQSAQSSTFQQLLDEKLKFENHIYSDLKAENEQLKQELFKKDQTLECLLMMKKQDSEIIMGLKDIIASLTMNLKEKENKQNQLQDKYNEIMESRIKIADHKRVLTEYIETDSELKDLTNHERFNQQQAWKDSFKPKENRDSHSKQKSKECKGVKERNERVQESEARGGQENEGRAAQENEGRKRSRPEVNKYKGMIENLRNNFVQYR